MPIVPVPASANSYLYRAFGLTFRSDIFLPELRVAEAAADPDVSIQLGPIPPPCEPVEPMGPYIRLNARLFLLDLPCARFAVSNGRDIVIEVRQGAAQADVRAFLLGSIMGVLCHQRGLLPLHAGAVAVMGSAFAFVGASGAGKSTLALQLHEQGHPLLCEDLCAVSVSPGKVATAWPGLVHFKLWRQSLEIAERSVCGLSPVLSSMDKYRFPARHLANDHAYPLMAIYVLARQEDDPFIIRRLWGIEAAKALVSHTYKGRFIPPASRSAHLSACAEVLRSVSVFQVTRRWGLNLIAGDAKRLEEHFREFLRSSKETMGFDIVAGAP